MDKLITCPNCQHRFSIDEVMAKEAKQRLEQQIRQQLRAQLMQQAEEEKCQLIKELEQKWQQQQEQQELKLKNRDEQLAKYRADNLKMMAEKDAWELEKENLQLEHKKKLQTEREKIVQETYQKVREEQQLKIAEKDKKLADFEIKVAELQRKLEQGSQQLQGEVLELELEEVLRQEFSDDIIEPIAKGKNGADIRQRVFDKKNNECGKIIWESKRAQHWSENWIVKLKQDVREEKAELAVLVTTVLPKNMDKDYQFYQGIWVCKPNLAVFVSQLLRFNLIRLCYVLESQESKDEKIEALYRYLTGPEFVAKIETQLEVLADLQADLDKEKRLALKRFAQREQQLAQLQSNVITLYGGLQGVTHNALPEVKLLMEGN